MKTIDIYRFLTVTRGCLGATLAAALSSSAALAIDWSESTIASGPNDLGQAKVVAVDHAGQTHVVYTRTNAVGGAALLHAVQGKPGGPWVIANVDKNMTITGSGQLSLAVNSEGTLHLSYVVKVGGTGFLAHRQKRYVDANWSTLFAVDGAVSLDDKAGTSIRVRPDGRPVIAYSDKDGILAWAKRDAGGSWTTSVINAQPGVGYYPSLALGGPVLTPVTIAHYDAVGQDLKFSELRVNFPGPDGWVTGNIETDGDSGSWANLERKPDGILSVAYHKREGFQTMVRYAEQVASRTAFIGHQTVDIDTLRSVGKNLSMRIDPVGNPVLAYNISRGIDPGSRPSIYYRRRSPGGAWEYQELESLSATATSRVAMDLAGDGAPVIVYDVDAGATSTLKATRPTWSTWVFTSPRPSGLSTILQTSAASLAIDASGGKHLCAYVTRTLGGRALLYVDMRKETPVRHDIPSTDRIYSSTGIAVDPSDTIHFVGLGVPSDGAANGQLYYYRRRNGSFQGGAPIQSAKNEELEMECDANGNVHLVFKTSGGTAGYGFLAAGTTAWQFKDVENSDNVSLFSLALNSSGHVGISGFDPTARRVLYFRKLADSTSFTRREVRTLGGGLLNPFTTSLAYMGDSPRIAYAAGREVFISEPSSGFSFLHREVDSFPEPVEVKMVADNCDRLHLVYAYPFSATATRTPVGCIIYNDADHTATSHDVGTLPGLRTRRLNLRLERGLSGMPQAAFTMQRDAGSPDAKTVIVARSSDSLDYDGDGLTLLREQAHVLDEGRRDDVPGGVRSFASVPRAGGAYLRAIFRHPAMGTTVETSTRYDVGAFSFRSEYSETLQCFGAAPAGAVPISLETTPVGLGVSESGLGYGLSDSFTRDHGHGFMRLSVRRITPGMP